MRNLKLSIFQTALQWHQPEANRAHFEELILALDEPTDVIVLPEMFSTGFTMDAENQAETMDGETVAWMREMAARKGAVICGSVVIEDEGDYYNRFIWMRADGSLATYDKRHLFRMAKEDAHYSAGVRRVVVELEGWRICPQVCYDLRFPVWSRNRNDYDLLIYVANWPSARRTSWQTLLRARAMENLCYVAGVNRVGTDGNDIAYSGDSAVCDYVGRDLVSRADEPLVATVSLDCEKLERFRKKFPAHLDADDFTIHTDDE